MDLSTQSRILSYRSMVVMVSGVDELVKASATTAYSLQSFIRKELLTDLQLSSVMPSSGTTVASPKVDGLVSLNVFFEGMTTCSFKFKF